MKLETLLTQSCHKSHKKWDRACRFTNELHNILLPASVSGTSALSPTFEVFMKRFIVNGNWEGTFCSTSAVRVGWRGGRNETVGGFGDGVSWKRKTMSVYHYWFPMLL